MMIKTFDMETTGFYDMKTSFDKLCYLLQLCNERIERENKCINSDDYTEYQKAMSIKTLPRLFEDKKTYTNKLAELGADLKWMF